MSTWILVDLDGTLYDSSHRAHLVQGENRGKDESWAQHSMERINDTLVESVATVVRELATTHRVAICTGGHDTARDITIEMLKRDQIPFSSIMFREAGSRISNGQHKVSAVNEIRRQGDDVVLAIEDYDKAAQALEDVGVPCLLVTSRSGF